MKECIFLQTGPDEITAGYGRVAASETAAADRPSFYVNDFFLESGAPWLIPNEVRTMPLGKFRSLIGRQEKSVITPDWKPVAREDFRRSFDEIQSLIGDGILEKAVPVLFEHGTADGVELRTLAAAAASGARNLFLYGMETERGGMIGLSPELLFDRTGTELRTAALAGTRSASSDPKSLETEKEMREHRLVVEDIRQKLSPFGAATAEPTSPYDIGSLFHLRTIIRTTVPEGTQFEQIVSSLHPTAALGVYPGTERAKRFLRHDDETAKRGLFGAPFGIHYPGGRSLCIAAIRCVQWNGSSIRMGSGCGIIRESRFEAEFEELRLKRESVKSRFFPA